MPRPAWDPAAMRAAFEAGGGCVPCHVRLGRLTAGAVAAVERLAEDAARADREIDLRSGRD
ncbi:MAG: hypothetical protein M3O70_24070 [Actinomycetota bacterium]|nr:hypothetical protein [Actinomycetota bacterium]